MIKLIAVNASVLGKSFELNKYSRNLPCILAFFVKKFGFRTIH